MKILIKKNVCRKSTLPFFIGLLTFLLLFQVESFAQINQDKTLRKEFELGRNGDLKIFHRNGPLIVKKSNDNQTRVQLNMYISGEEEEDIVEVFNRIELKEEGYGSKMELTTSFEYESWVSNNGDIQIRFEDGTKVRDLSKVQLEMIVFLPQVQNLHLENKYDNIEVTNIDANLGIKIYSGEVHVGNVYGDLNLDMKYGQGHIGNVKNGVIKLYDTELLLGNGRDLDITSKYSNFTLGNVDNCKLNTYDDEYKIETIREQLTIIDKYSDIKLISFDDSEMNLYDSEIKVDNGQTLALTSKYSDCKIKSIDKLDIATSHDDDFTIDEISDLKCNSKYSTYNIDYFKGALSVYSYDDVIDVDKVASSFKDVIIEGKYAKVSFPIPKEVAYTIDANMTHGNLAFNEDKFADPIFRQKSSKIEINAKTVGANTNSPVIVIKAYDSRVDLN